MLRNPDYALNWVVKYKYLVAVSEFFIKSTGTYICFYLFVFFAYLFFFVIFFCFVFVYLNVIFLEAATKIHSVRGNFFPAKTRKTGVFRSELGYSQLLIYMQFLKGRLGLGKSSEISLALELFAMTTREHTHDLHSVYVQQTDSSPQPISVMLL